MQFWGSSFSWLILLVAILGDFAVPYGLAFFYPNYSHRKQVMSELGSTTSPVSKLYNLWLFLLGVLFCVSSINIYMVYSEHYPVLSVMALMTLLVFGLGAGIIPSFFQVTEDNIETLASKVHGIASGIGFILLALIPLIMGLMWIKSKDYILGYTAIVFFFLSIGNFVLFIMSEKETFKNSVIGMTGLWQRLLLLAMYVPLLLMVIYHI